MDMGTNLLPPLRVAEGIPTDSSADFRLSRIAMLIASGEATSKAGLTAATGWARSSVSAQVDLLLRRGVLVHAGQSVPARGRPAERLAISPAKGLVLVADMGGRHAHLGVADMGLTLLAHEFMVLDVRKQSPEATLAMVAEQLLALKRRCAPDTASAICVIGLPARLDITTGTPVRPPVMPGWDGFAVAHEFSRLVGCRCMTENDVNLRALGESVALGPGDRPLLAVKIGTGIGSGLIDSRGDIYHGFDGSAGEVGHTQVRRSPAIECACGNVGCIEVVASVPGVLRRLRELAPDLLPMDTAADLIQHCASGDRRVQQVVREAGDVVGEAIAFMCNVLNPRRVVISGTLARISDDVLAAIRTAAYQTARPLAIRHVTITRSVLGELGGVAGAMALGVREWLGPNRVLEMPQRPRQPAG